MNEAFLLTGGNMGDRVHFLARARDLIEAQCGTITALSSLYETAAWGKEDQGAFLNQAVKINTTLSATALLTAVLDAEVALGRKRELKYGPRIIDIDILFFNDDIIDGNGLRVPHPEMQRRRFVLAPLNEIAPEKIHPVLHKSVSTLLTECTDPLAVNKIN